MDVIIKLENLIGEMIIILNEGEIDAIYKEINNFFSFLIENKEKLYLYMKKQDLSKIDEESINKIEKGDFIEIHNYFINKIGIENIDAMHFTEIYEGLLFCKKVFDYKEGEKHSYDSLHEILFELYEHLIPMHIKYLL